MSVAENLAALRERIPEHVTIVGVTKQQAGDVVHEAVAAGLFDLGENRADGLIARAAANPDERVRWHFLGQIQRNKIGKVAPYVSLWQAVDRAELGPAIARHAPGASVLVEVNLTDDPNRGGTSLAAVPALVRDLRADGLDVRGLMAVGPLGHPEAARPGFTAVVRCADELALPVRSLGMSDDVDVAIACGSTMVRIGTALFGARPMPRNKEPFNVE
jgi:PLP dependent protein